MTHDTILVMYDLIQAEPDNEKFLKAVDKLDDKWNAMINDRENLRRLNNLDVRRLR